MKVLFIGDIVGRRARNYAQEKIIELKTKLKLDAIIVNVENSAGGFGVTPSICDDFFRVGADVLTTGNHIWDKREIISYITKNDRLLRPLNMIEGTPGLGMTTVDLDAGKIGVANIMTNLFMQKTDNVFDKKQKNFITIGIAYSKQETKSIPYESHDQKLDFIVTEKEILSKVN